ncbi:MAG: tRNA preQ1(34) S-adenosylmethionine ribosyltransferase-isomerase QueA [Spirochaetes bacterium]|nr:tRNA preQ1(34) S-adenosylmethionine ribosyltransferase-isomerase QueA [Spirochaetota bacterium]
MPEKKYTLDDFYFELPDELIAQQPAENRDASRLLVLDRSNDSIVHAEFADLPRFLTANDILVFNDARVIHARVYCRRETGGMCELLLTGRLDGNRWNAITNRTRRLKAGETLQSAVDPSITFMVCGRDGDSLEIESTCLLNDEVLASIGQIALPPYIRRSATEHDDDRYQTVFAKESGAVAAPTAGLHFTDGLLRVIGEMGARWVFLTLYVSWGTFLPVRTQNLENHHMHVERYILPDSSAQTINEGRKKCSRIIAVGTTSLRVLEATFHNGVNIPGEGETDIFIYPPRKVLSSDALITNFHTPHSTLLMLVSAFAGHESIMSAYREAVCMKYRFFSYGDAMFII